jgi:hypothetical protein
MIGWRFFALPSRRFRTVDADLTWLPSDVDPTEWLAGIVLVGDVDGTVLKVRYTVTAAQRRRMDEARVRRVLLEAGTHRLFLEPDVVREERARGAELSDRLDMDAAVDAWLTTHGCEPAFSSDVRELVAAWRPGDAV